MKAFVIFPTICVFLLALVTFKLSIQDKHRTRLLFSIFATALIGGVMTWYSVYFFRFLLYAYFIGVLVCIASLTFLGNQLLSKSQDKGVNWIRLLGLGILSTIVTIVIAGYLFLISCIYNPMDPAANKNPAETIRN